MNLRKMLDSNDGPTFGDVLHQMERGEFPKELVLSGAHWGKSPKGLSPEKQRALQHKDIAYSTMFGTALIILLMKKFGIDPNDPKAGLRLSIELIQKFVCPTVIKRQCEEAAQKWNENALIRYWFAVQCIKENDAGSQEAAIKASAEIPEVMAILPAKVMKTPEALRNQFFKAKKLPAVEAIEEFRENTGLTTLEIWTTLIADANSISQAA